MKQDSKQEIMCVSFFLCSSSSEYSMILRDSVNFIAAHKICNICSTGKSGLFILGF